MSHQEYIESHALQRSHALRIVIKYCTRAMNDFTLDIYNCPFHKNRIYDHDIAVADLLTRNALRRYGKRGQVVGVNVREARAAKTPWTV